MRLIDADLLKRQMESVCMGIMAGTDSYGAPLKTIDNAPTVDAEPVKHGHWIESDVGLMCSECNHYTETMYYEPFNNEFGKGWALKRPYYCGYCGAKMDEVEDGKTD